MAGQSAMAQNASNLPGSKLAEDVLQAIGVPTPNHTPLSVKTIAAGLPVKLIYDGPELKGRYGLTLTVFKKEASGDMAETRTLSETTLHLEKMDSKIEAVLTRPALTDGLQIKAALRDVNQNLVLETAHSLPILSYDPRILVLSPAIPPEPELISAPDISGIERISGKIILPRKASLPFGSNVHIQLLENALAGGLSLELAAQNTRPAVTMDGTIPFTLNRGIWDQRNTPDLAFKVWITDPQGRKSYVMGKPVSYNGPDIDYVIQLDGLKQGKQTKRGRNLNPDLMAQALILGEAEFDPVNGIPGQARLQIKLSQDRGDFNRNPVLAEQTLLLRGMETRIPFSLTTDSTHFDPYAPAPFLSVSLTDVHGRIYYQSGEIRAREGRNSVRLYPR